MGEAAPQVVEALQRVIDWQTRDILYGELVRYLVGTDPETEIAAQAGIVFHPLPPAVPEILQWDAAAVEQWQRRIAPNLEQMDRDYASLTARLRALRPTIPEDGLPWFDEILDGIEVTGLRARHALHVYGSLVLLRQSRLTGDPALQAEARRWLDAAHADTEAALEVVHRREQGYRYRPLERSIAGGPEGDQDENWTVYRFRYLNRTHHAFYYTRIDNLAEEAFAGADAPYLVTDALLAPGEALAFQLLDPTLTEPTLDLGDGATSSERVVTHTYEAPGTYDLTLSAIQDGVPLEPPIRFSVAALTGELSTGFTGRIIEPAGAALITPLLPGLVLGRLDAETLALGFDLSGQGKVSPDQWRTLPAASPDGYAAAPFEVVVPVINRSTHQIQTQVEVTDATLTHADDALTLAGMLDTDSIIQAIVQVGGFEPDGARRLVASTLGYTADTLPDAVPFSVVFEAR
jgi:hypothetical protein